MPILRFLALLPLLVGGPHLFARASCEYELAARPVSLTRLQWEIQNRGVLSVVTSPYRNARGLTRRMTVTEQLKLSEMYGTPIVVEVFDAARPAKRVYRQVVLNFSDAVTGDVDYRGKVQLFHSTRLLRSVHDNKWMDFKVAESLQPGSMPLTRQAADILKDYSGRVDYLRVRASLRRSLDTYMQAPQAEITPALTTKVVKLLSHFLKAVNEAFPGGAFIKNISEAATGDRGQQISTPKSEPEELAKVFVSEIERIRRESGRPLGGADSPTLKEKLNEGELSAARLVRALLVEASDIIVQQKVKIARTRDSTLNEVRVDFCAGEPLNATLRWGYDVAIDYKRRALEFFAKLWAKAPADLRRLCGGADVAMLEDGSLRLIEFNFGRESGFVDAQSQLLSANLFLSRVLGRRTPLIRQLESLVGAPVENQIRYLSTTIPRMKTDAETHRSIRDMYLPEAFQFLRDRMIEQWLENPSAAKADLLAARFRRLAKSQLERVKDETLRKLISDMAAYGEDYMREKLNAD